MVKRKGQFFLAGMLLIGLSLITLGFSTFEFESQSEGQYVFRNLEQTVPSAAERFSSTRGMSFMEKYHFFSLNHRQNAEAVEITVVAGFQEGQDMKVFTGNFRGEEQQVNISVNGENFQNRLKGDKIVYNTTGASDSYSVEVEGEYFSESMTALDDKFLVVAYRHSTKGAARQDTYTS